MTAFQTTFAARKTTRKMTTSAERRPARSASEDAAERGITVAAFPPPRSGRPASAGDVNRQREQWGNNGTNEPGGANGRRSTDRRKSPGPRSLRASTASSNWGSGYFSVNADGHVAVHPTQKPGRQRRLEETGRTSCGSGTSRCRCLIRFTDILRHRVGQLHAAFAKAIKEHDYRGEYRCVYPIKVNQQRHVVQEIHDHRQGVRLRPRSRQQAGAAGGAGDRGRRQDADHLQRLQGRRIHRGGDPGDQDREEHHPGGGKIQRAGADREVRQAAQREAEHRRAGEAGRQAARAGGNSPAACAASSGCSSAR